MPEQPPDQREPLPEFREKPQVITVEGLAATGTTTLCQEFHERYGYDYLSVSLIARGLSVVYSEKEGRSLDDADAVSRFYRQAYVEVELDGMENRITVNGIDTTSRLKTPRTDEAASSLFKYGVVRAKAAREARKVAEENGNVVLDGRRVGQEITPEAPLKIFLTADFEERIARQLKDRFVDDSLFDGATARDALERRDEKERAGFADIPPEDAFLVDTTGVSPDDYLTRIVTAYNYEVLRSGS